MFASGVGVFMFTRATATAAISVVAALTTETTPARCTKEATTALTTGAAALVSALFVTSTKVG